MTARPRGESERRRRDIYTAAPALLWQKHTAGILRAVASHDVQHKHRCSLSILTKTFSYTNILIFHQTGVLIPPFFMALQRPPAPQRRHCPTLCHGHDACRPHAAADNLPQRRGQNDTGPATMSCCTAHNLNMPTVSIYLPTLNIYSTSSSICLTSVNRDYVGTQTR